MSSQTKSSSLADAAKAAGDILGQGAQLAMGLLGAVKVPKPLVGCCSCEIPPPCWVPQSLDDVGTRVCPGNKAVLRLHVTNCGVSGRTIEVDAGDKDVVVDPSSITLGPMEEGTVTLSFEVPATATEGEVRKFLVWVRGCKVYVLPWTVEVACKNEDCCQDVDIEDCPDLVHHWYDHFYCQRPCPHRR